MGSENKVYPGVQAGSGVGIKIPELLPYDKTVFVLDPHGEEDWISVVQSFNTQNSSVNGFDVE
ncbi:hypothetical protein WDB62_003905 [Escherichia coli]